MCLVKAGCGRRAQLAAWMDRLMSIKGTVSKLCTLPFLHIFIFPFDFSSAPGTSDDGRLPGRRKCKGGNVSCVLTVEHFSFFLFFSSFSFYFY